MDPRSEKILASLHPDLAKVIRAASQSPQGFEAIYGVRTEQAEQQAVASGHSTTLHSRHLADPRYTSPEYPEGLSCAVDVAALINGEVSFAPGRETVVFGQIATQIKAAARTLNVPVQWGGDWHEFKDWGHFQLPWEQYP